MDLNIYRRLVPQFCFDLPLASTGETRVTTENPLARLELYYVGSALWCLPLHDHPANSVPCSRAPCYPHIKPSFLLVFPRYIHAPHESLSQEYPVTNLHHIIFIGFLLFFPAVPAVRCRGA